MKYTYEELMAMPLEEFHRVSGEDYREVLFSLDIDNGEARPLINKQFEACEKFGPKHTSGPSALPHHQINIPKKNKAKQINWSLIKDETVIGKRGIFSIECEGELIYIGRSINISTYIQNILTDTDDKGIYLNNCLNSNKEITFNLLKEMPVASWGEMEQEKKKYIEQYNPKLNKFSVEEGKYARKARSEIT